MEEHRDDRFRSQTYRELKANKMNYQAKAEAIALTHKPKYMYPQFNFFELEANRLASLPEYKVLAGEIVAFNQELDDWKKRNIEIRNLFISYNLYQNLYSRMKYTSNLVIDRAEAKRAFAEIIKWFAEQKPRIRNKAPDREEPMMKPSTADKETQCEIDTLLTSTQTKRELKVYEAMSRTAHSHLFPPKDRLADYRRKEIVQGINQERSLQRRAFSHNNIGKVQRYGKSFASTMTSFKHAVATQLRREESKIQPVVVPFQLKDPTDSKQLLVQTKNPPTQEQLREQEEMEKQKQVAQEELLQQNIVQVIHQQDAPDAEEEIYQEEEREQAVYKKFKQDPLADDQAIAQENIKDIKQSTLRRILKQKEEAIRSKMEELNIANQMLNWGAVKGRINSEAHTKSERRQLVNRYAQIQFIPKTFEERQSMRKREIPEYPLLFRSKSSHGPCIEREVERLKVGSALKTYGRYINHIEIRPVPEGQQEREELRVMRATSLTSFARQGKRTFPQNLAAPFSSIIQANATDTHNGDAEDYVMLAKERLAKQGIAVEKQTLLNALAATDSNRIQHKEAFPPQARLFSNPFFPKHLYQSKSKKKKK